ncbi:carboxymuconolactone decarboxylase family protein [bacterium]|nr:carboxymuconolactone decarboxylase family protein [bacterium]
MNKQTKELIAVGASIAGHCQPCLAYHTVKAKEAGLTEAEIREAMEVGRMVEQGAMSAMREFSKTVFGTPAESAAGCCPGAAAPGTKKCCG